MLSQTHKLKMTYETCMIQAKLAKERGDEEAAKGWEERAKTHPHKEPVKTEEEKKEKSK